MSPHHNPHSRAPPRGVSRPNSGGMGPQSQRRISLQDRTHRLAANSNRRSGQRTLVGGVAFDPIKDCPICKARHCNLRIPHRGHHKNCWNNPRTGGITSQTSLDTLRIGKAREKFFQQGLKTSEKHDARNNTREASRQFFAARPKATKRTEEMNIEMHE